MPIFTTDAPRPFRDVGGRSSTVDVPPDGRLDFFHLNDGLALIGPAIQTGIVRQLQFMALRTHGHAGRSDPQLLGPALVASRP